MSTPAPVFDIFLILFWAVYAFIELYSTSIEMTGNYGKRYTAKVRSWTRTGDVAIHRCHLNPKTNFKIAEKLPEVPFKLCSPSVKISCGS